MLQRLATALAQVKADNNSESLLNEIKQIVSSLYASKQITKKVIWNDVMSSFDDAKKTFFYQKAPKILTLPASNGNQFSSISSQWA